MASPGTWLGGMREQCPTSSTRVTWSVTTSTPSCRTSTRCQFIKTRKTRNICQSCGSIGHSQKQAEAKYKTPIFLKIPILGPFFWIWLLTSQEKIPPWLSLYEPPTSLSFSHPCDLSHFKIQNSEEYPQSGFVPFIYCEPRQQAELFEAAPNPILHHPHSEEGVRCFQLKFLEICTSSIGNKAFKVELRQNTISNNFPNQQYCKLEWTGSL